MEKSELLRNFSALKIKYMTETPDNRLWNKSFIYAFASNFLMMFAFYLLIPTLPFYLDSYFHSDKTTIGVVMSIYIVAALAIRPFSSYFIDTMDRKKLYIAAYIAFTLLFALYPFASMLGLFILLRILHGFTFGITTTAGNTLAIDILPSTRRGEGIGYFGLSTNIAMAMGPMTGLFLMEIFDFAYIFWFAFMSGIIGLLMTISIHAPHHKTMKHEPIFLDRFILVKAIPSGINLLLLSLSYGLIISFGAVFGKEIMASNTGLFYTLLATGIFVARFSSGRFLNAGKFKPIGTISIILLTICFALLAQTTQAWEYYTLAVFIGLGFGMLTPAFQTMTVNMAPHSKRGTANSTFFTSLDLGVGGGMLLGGQISQIWNLNTAFAIVAAINLIGLFLFIRCSIPLYNKNKVVDNH